MRTRVPSATLLSIVVVLLLLAGCGGDEQSGGGGEQGGGEQGGGEQGGGQQNGGGQGGGGGAGERSAKKIALGSIESVQPDSRKIVLEPQFEEQGEGQRTFNVRKNAEIRVNDQEAELSEIQTGQSAQIEYVTKNEINRAVAVEIVGGG